MSMTTVLRWLTATLICLACVLFTGCADRSRRNLALAASETATEYVGSTPGEARVKEFLGGLNADAPCDHVAWQIRFFTNAHAGQPSTFRIAAQYHVPTQANPNRWEDGPRVAVEGTWEFGPEASSRPGAMVRRLRAAESERSLALVEVGGQLLHLLNADGTLAVGNGGWSYTLNRAAAAETPGDLQAALNGPGMSYQISPRATGPAVYGVYEGRSPCHGISRELGMPQHAGCIKSKWRMTLYQDPATSLPTTYKVEGSLFREGAREGTWRLTRGAALDGNATVLELNSTATQPALRLLRGDENVLFFLDHQRELLVGHAEFSYTLNRVMAQ